jgi:hypothetical protein
MNLRPLIAVLALAFSMALALPTGALAGTNNGSYRIPYPEEGAAGWFAAGVGGE